MESSEALERAGKHSNGHEGLMQKDAESCPPIRMLYLSLH